MEVNGEREEEMGAQVQVQVAQCLSNYVDEGSVESHRYYLSRKTVLEMLKDRGFSIPSSEIGQSLSEFRAIHGQSPDIERLRFSATHSSDPSKRIMVCYCWPGLVKVTVVRSLASQLLNTDTLSGMILVVQDRITPQAMKALQGLKFKVEVFQLLPSAVHRLFRRYLWLFRAVLTPSAAAVAGLR